ncbi:MAG: HAD family hydrolase [Deltaproteobacteria bacterium]|nr:HAD family hydrolase [Deltaproteobacteria bacterium]
MEGEAAITTVLFDAGGTLVHLDYRFLHRELHRAGIPVTRTMVRRAECASRLAVDRRMLAAVPDTDETRRHPYFAALLAQLGIDPEAAAPLIARFDAAHAQDNLWRVMPRETRRVLAGLRERGLTLGVISNSDGRIAAVLEQCGIAQFFDVVIDSHDVGVEKPNPRIFHLALEQAGARPEEAIFVGDIYSIDILGAERAGMRPVLIDALGCYAEGKCEKIRHLRELLFIV